MHALQYLQRALLVHELQKLSAIEWEACFNKVLFPLLAKLLENIDPTHSMRMEETRMRASTLLCKVFLQHLTTLARLSTFTALWLTILDYMDKYIKSSNETSKTDNLLHDVIPESLKNMLLVMETTGLFNSELSQLSIITKDRIESFLPGLWSETFKINSKNELKVVKPSSPPPTPMPTPSPPPPPEIQKTTASGAKIQSDEVDSSTNVPQAESQAAAVGDEVNKNNEIKDI
jgi:brefeldin A-resistance guanine nucleotide exchange factor 1